MHNAIVLPGTVTPARLVTFYLCIGRRFHIFGYTLTTAALLFICVFYVTLVKDALVSPTPSIGDVKYSVAWSVYGYDDAIANTDSHHIVVAGNKGKSIERCPQFDYLYPNFDAGIPYSSAPLDWRVPSVGSLEFLKFVFGVATSNWVMFLVLFKIMWAGLDPDANLGVVSFGQLLHKPLFCQELFRPNKNNGAPTFNAGPNTLWHVRETVFFWRLLKAFAACRKEYWTSINEKQKMCSACAPHRITHMCTDKGNAVVAEKRVIEEWLVESVLEGMFRDGLVSSSLDSCRPSTALSSATKSTKILSTLLSQVVPYSLDENGEAVPAGWTLWAKFSALFLEPYVLFAMLYFCFLPPAAVCWDGKLSKPNYWKKDHKGKNYKDKEGEKPDSGEWCVVGREQHNFTQFRYLVTYVVSWACWASLVRANK